MAISINAYIKSRAIKLEQLKNELTDFFDSNNINTEKSNESILLSNIVLNNELICYFIERSDMWLLDDKNDKEYEYTYQTEISFSINKICQDGNYNNNIVDNESRIQDFYKIISQKYKCEILIFYLDEPYYILNCGKRIELMDIDIKM